MNETKEIVEHEDPTRGSLAASPYVRNLCLTRRIAVRLHVIAILDCRLLVTSQLQYFTDPFGEGERNRVVRAECRCVPVQLRQPENIFCTVLERKRTPVLSDFQRLRDAET